MLEVRAPPWLPTGLRPAPTPASTHAQWERFRRRDLACALHALPDSTAPIAPTTLVSPAPWAATLLGQHLYAPPVPRVATATILPRLPLHALRTRTPLRGPLTAPRAPPAFSAPQPPRWWHVPRANTVLMASLRALHAPLVTTAPPPPPLFHALLGQPPRVVWRPVQRVRRDTTPMYRG